MVTIHWDDKLLPDLDVRSSMEERLPIVITYEDKEQLLAMPKLVNLSVKEHALDKVRMMCCDSTASNTGRFNGACEPLEQKLGRELLLFTCSHHVYKLIKSLAVPISHSSKTLKTI